MKKLLERLEGDKVLVSDGAWGTLLQERGLEPGECPESWNESRDSDVLAVASSYVYAGADLIETNSFGGSSIKLGHWSLSEKAFALNKAAARISREAAGTDTLVLGSIGPSGKILMMGGVNEKQLYESFSEQAKALCEGGADAIVVETFMDLEEATIAISAAKEQTPLEVICTMTFEKGANGQYFTMMGVSPTQMTSSLPRVGADIIGANCGNGMENMVEITREIRKADSVIPVLIHANAGMPELRDGITVFPETPEQTAGHVPNLLEAGANIIGGCCGTTPAHIREIATAIRG